MGDIGVVKLLPRAWAAQSTASQWRLSKSFDLATPKPWFGSFWAIQEWARSCAWIFVHTLWALQCSSSYSYLPFICSTINLWKTATLVGLHHLTTPRWLSCETPLRIESESVSDWDLFNLVFSELTQSSLRIDHLAAIEGSGLYSLTEPDRHHPPPSSCAWSSDHTLITSSRAKSIV